MRVFLPTLSSDHLASKISGSADNRRPAYSFLNCFAISRINSGRKIGINRINNSPCRRSFSDQIRIDPRPVASSIDGQSSCFSAHVETVRSGSPSLSDNSLLVYDAIDPHIAPQSPTASTIACPMIYAAATNAVGQIASGEAADNTAPPPTATPSLRLANFLIRSIFRSFSLCPSQRLDLSRQMRPNGVSLRDLVESSLLRLLQLRELRIDVVRLGGHLCVCHLCVSCFADGGSGI